MFFFFFFLENVNFGFVTYVRSYCFVKERFKSGFRKEIRNLLFHLIMEQEFHGTRRSNIR